MSINEKGNVEEILPPYVASLLENMPAPLDDTTFIAFKPILGEGAILNAIKQYRGGNGFMNNLVGQLNKGRTLSDKQLRGACNVFRSILRGEASVYTSKPGQPSNRAGGFGPQASPPTVQAPTAAPTGAFKCFTCQAPFNSMQEVLDHKRIAHGNITRPSSPPSWKQPTPQAPPPPPMFQPKYGLDLRLIPDGRYAVIEAGKTEATYVLKRTIKRPYQRRGRYIWGASTRWGEWIEKGRMEVRIQRGDTKELVGEQNTASNVYHGEHEEAVKLIMNDPAKAIALYGLLMKSCGYCGRSLTDPLSQARGVGPDCWEAKHIHLLNGVKV